MPGFQTKKSRRGAQLPNKVGRDDDSRQGGNALSPRRQELRDALVEAATRIIAQSGFQALRARDLAAAVGCAVGAIYNVFADLDAVILAVKATTLDALQAEILRQLGPDTSTTSHAARDRLVAMARVYLSFASNNRRLWFSAFEHSSPDTSSLDAYMLRLDAIFSNIEGPLALLAPKIQGQRRPLLARALFSAVHGVVALGLDMKLGVISPEALIWQVETILGAALSGLTTGRR